MDNLLEKSKNLIFIAVVSSLIASIITLLWGAVKTVLIIIDLIKSYGKDPLLATSLIDLMHLFLIAAALFIFSVGMYELFIKEIKLPEWLVIHNLQDLNAKLSSVIILVMAVKFLEHLVEWKDPKGIMYIGIAVAAVSAALIGFSYFGGKD